MIVLVIDPSEFLSPEFSISIELIASDTDVRPGEVGGPTVPISRRALRHIRQQVETRTTAYDFVDDRLLPATDNEGRTVE